MGEKNLNLVLLSEAPDFSRFAVSLQFLTFLLFFKNFYYHSAFNFFNLYFFLMKRSILIFLFLNIFFRYIFNYLS